MALFAHQLEIGHTVVARCRENEIKTEVCAFYLLNFNTSKISKIILEIQLFIESKDYCTAHLEIKMLLF